MSAATPPFLYRLVALCLLPAYGIHALLRARKDGGRRYLKQRFGFVNQDTVPRLWLHAASVGEVQTALPLVRAALIQDNAQQLLVTTTTPTGFMRVSEQLIKEFPERVIHRYTPIDQRVTTRRFLSRHVIEAVWIVETEIWPWLYSEANRINLPVTIINGRLTDKTISAANGWLKRSYQRALRNVTVLARSDRDAEAFVTLGAESDKVTTLGDLKFSDNRPANTPPLIPDRYCIAASTHPDEELQLARQWLDQSIQSLLVFAPRHVERGELIHKQLTELLSESNLDADSALAPLRSQGGEPSEHSRLYVADTLGELSSWYAHADVAFVGGSLIARGGHNMLEPMHAGVPTIVGPHTDNFKEAMAYLRKFGAVTEVRTAAEAIETMDQLTHQAERRENQRRAIDNAARGVEAMVEKYLERLLT